MIYACNNCGGLFSDNLDPIAGRICDCSHRQETEHEKVVRLEKENAALRAALDIWKGTVDLIDFELNRGTDGSRVLPDRLNALGNIATVLHARERATSAALAAAKERR